MRKPFFASIRCALKTTNEPLDVIYNVLVGCYSPLCNNDLKREPLGNEGLIKYPVGVTLVGTPSKLPGYHQMCATMSWLLCIQTIIIRTH